MRKQTIAMVAALLLVALAAVTVNAQSRDYAISTMSYAISGDEQTITVYVTVTNAGADATTTTDVVLRQIISADEQRDLESIAVAPLDGGESQQVQFDLDAADFPADSRQQLQASVGIDSFELAGSSIAEDNVQSITVPIPATGSAQSAPATSTDTPMPSMTDDPAATGNGWLATIPITLEGDTISAFGYTATRTEAAIGIGVGTGALLMLWLLSVIFRLVFSRPPTYDVWQPPYSLVPMVDPNSTEGRRQAWQGYAKNSLLLGAPTEGNVHPVKRLLGADGSNLANWQLKAARLSQYDQYGRIERTEYVLPAALVKRLNKVIAQRETTGQEKLQQQLERLAERMVKGFKKTLSEKNAFLPVALDMRWRGTHGDVRIVFELYQCQGQAWYRIDQWEPSLSFIAESLQEEFTYTIHGCGEGEDKRDFYARLQHDIRWLLLETLREDPPQYEPEVPHESYNVPDTLSGMAPITEA